MKKAPTPSDKTQQEAEQMANATKKPGQTKAQTKLIEQGIAKGIALYKKQHKEKLRQLDKEKKKRQKQTSSQQEKNETPTVNDSAMPQQKTHRLPWVLLAISWALFVGYVMMTSGL